MLKGYIGNLVKEELEKPGMFYEVGRKASGHT